MLKYYFIGGSSCPVCSIFVLIHLLSTAQMWRLLDIYGSVCDASLLYVFHFFLKVITKASSDFKIHKPATSGETLWIKKQNLNLKCVTEDKGWGMAPVLCCTYLCCAIPLWHGRDKHLILCCSLNNPAWQPCGTSDGGNAARKQIGRNRRGICLELIRSECIHARGNKQGDAYAC